MDATNQTEFEKRKATFGGAGQLVPEGISTRLSPWAKGRGSLRGLAGRFLRRGARSFLPTAFCLLLSAYCLLPAVLNAQGCAMCYNSASAAKAGAKEALANGVLILLVPPMVFFGLISVVVYKYRNKFRDPVNWRPEHDRELQELLADLAPVNGIQGLESGSTELIKGQVHTTADRVDGAL
jgi:hypothetical protein